MSDLPGPSVTVGVLFEVAHDDSRREVFGGSVHVTVIGNWDDLADYERERCLGILEQFLSYNRSPQDAAPCVVVGAVTTNNQPTTEENQMNNVTELVEAAKNCLLHPSSGEGQKRLEVAVRAFDHAFRVHPERCGWRPTPNPNPPSGPPAPPIACGQVKGHDGPHRTWRGNVIGWVTTMPPPTSAALDARRFPKKGS